SISRAAAQMVANRPTGAGSVFLAPGGGLASFIAALTASLTGRGAELHDHTPVRAVEPRGPGWAVMADDRSGGEREFTADGVVIATPAGVTAGLLADHAPTASQHLRGIRHASVALVALAYAPESLTASLGGSGFLVPRGEGLLCTAASWASSKWEHL